MGGELLPFFIVLFAAVFFSELFFKFHFPWVVALIIGGIVIGPTGFDVFQSNQVIEFLSDIGLVFLMFMAGLESHLLGKRHDASLFPFLKIALYTSVIPFIAALAVSQIFGLSFVASIFVGITFISSSVAAILPTLEEKQLLHCKLGRTIVSSVIISDIMSLVALSIVLQTIAPQTKLPLLLFYPLLFILLLFLKWFIPKLFSLYKADMKNEKDIYHQDMRTVFLLLIGTALSFQLLGLHAIVAGFFAGVVLSGTLQSKTLYENIRAVSYGIFIPIFFLLIGVQVHIGEVLFDSKVLLFTVSLCGIAILSKLLAGYFGGLAAKFSKKESSIIGASAIPQLSTTLAVALTGLEAGIITSDIVTALIVVSLVTTTVGSLLIGFYSKDYIRDEVEVVD